MAHPKHAPKEDIDTPVEAHVDWSDKTLDDVDKIAQKAKTQYPDETMM
jgi:hypothetical protein